jgi:hypothetical protein
MRKFLIMYSQIHENFFLLWFIITNKNYVILVDRLSEKRLNLCSILEPHKTQIIVGIDTDYSDYNK